MSLLLYKHTRKGDPHRNYTGLGVRGGLRLGSASNRLVILSNICTLSDLKFYHVYNGEHDVPIS